MYPEQAQQDQRESSLRLDGGLTFNELILSADTRGQLRRLIGPNESLAASLGMLRDGNWVEFDKLRFKERSFAVLASIMDILWEDYLKPVKDRNPEANGFHRIRTGPEGTNKLEPVSSFEVKKILGGRNETRKIENLLSFLNDTFTLSLSRLLDDLKDKRIGMLSGGRDLYTLWQEVAYEEAAASMQNSGANVWNPTCRPGKELLFGIIYKGYEFGIAIMFLLPKERGFQTALTLARAHGATSSFLRQTMNSGDPNDPFRFSSIESLNDAFKAAVLNPENFVLAERKIAEELSVGNASYSPATFGCPATYTPLFKGIFEWLLEIKDLIKQN